MEDWNSGSVTIKLTIMQVLSEAVVQSKPILTEHLAMMVPGQYWPFEARLLGVQIVLDELVKEGRVESVNTSDGVAWKALPAQALLT